MCLLLHKRRPHVKRQGNALSKYKKNTSTELSQSSMNKSCNTGTSDIWSGLHSWQRCRSRTPLSLSSWPPPQPGSSPQRPPWWWWSSLGCTVTSPGDCAHTHKSGKSCSRVSRGGSGSQFHKYLAVGKWRDIATYSPLRNINSLWLILRGVTERCESLTLRWWSWCLCPVLFFSSCAPLSRSGDQQSCHGPESSEGPHQHCKEKHTCCDQF